MAGQLRVGQPGALEVEVVQDGVLDAGIDQVAGIGLFPDAFGRPEAADGGPQAALQPAGVAADLAHAVAGGNHRQDWLEIGPAEDLDPPGVDELRQPIDVVGVMAGEPFHQRAADVQRNFQRRVAAENVQEHAVAVVVGALEDFIEIADGLVIVQGEDETDWVGHDLVRCSK